MCAQLCVEADIWDKPGRMRERSAVIVVGGRVVFQAERLASAKALRQRSAWPVGVRWVEWRGCSGRWDHRGGGPGHVGINGVGRKPLEGSWHGSDIYAIPLERISLAALWRRASKWQRQNQEYWWGGHSVQVRWDIGWDQVMGSGGGRKVTGVSPSYLSIKSLFGEYFLISLRMHFGKRVIYKQMSIICFCQSWKYVYTFLPVLICSG